MIGVKWSLFMSTFLFIIGSYLYGMATTSWMVLLGRILEGIWAGSVNALLRSYITKSTTKINIIKVDFNIILSSVLFLFISL